MTESGHYIVGKVPFRIGVSYAPRGSAPGFWQRFDVDEVHEDFSILAELGINLARVALDWEHFQRDPESLSCRALAHLLNLCDAAASEGVKLELLLFAGDLRQPERLPAWLRDEARLGALGPNGCGDPNCAQPIVFSHPSAKTAAYNLVRGVARSVAKHPAVWAYNLGDRPDRLAPSVCRAAANTWFQELSEVVHSVDPKHPVTCSLGGASLTTNAGLRVDHVFSALDHSTIDSDGLAGELGPSDLESQVIFSCALTSALTRKPCLSQENWQLAAKTGSTSAADENGISVKSLLSGLHRVGAIGAVIGTFTERSASDGAASCGGFDLLDCDGQPSVHAEAILEFTRSKPLVQRPAIDPLALGLTADEYYEAPSAHIRRLYEQFHDREASLTRGG